MLIQKCSHAPQGRNMIVAYKIFIYLILLMSTKYCGGSEPHSTEDYLSDSFIKDLYRKYKEAVDTDAELVILRRQFEQNRLFEIHIKKLKEVNGLKQHNLMIKEKARTGNNPFIYINNPVEAKIPHAFLTLEEFKEALTNRVKNQRLTTPRNYVVVFSTENFNRRKTIKIISLAADVPTKASIFNDIFKSRKRVEKKILSAPLAKNGTSELLDKIHQQNSKLVADNSSHITKTIFNNINDKKFTNSDTSTHARIAKSDEIKEKLKTNNLTTANIEKFIFLRASLVSDITTVKNKHTSETTEKYGKTSKYISFPVTERITIKTGITEDYTTKNEFFDNITCIKPTEVAVISINKLTETEQGNISNTSLVTTELINTIQKKSLERTKTSKFNAESLERPKSLVTKLITPSGRHTPWRKRTSLTTKVIKNPVGTKRSTLGRPLVFMGGP